MAERFKAARFILCGTAFYMATLAAGIYGLDAARLNLWLALTFTLLLNPLGLAKRRLLCWGMAGAAAALAAFYVPTRIWGAWLFAGYLGMAAALSDSKASGRYAWLIIFAAGFFNLSFITNTSHTDVQYDFISCYNYIEYILDNNFLFWHENPLLTRPSYSSYHPILHFFLAAGIMRTGILISGNAVLAAEAAQTAFCFYMLWYYVLAAKILRFFKLKAVAELAGLAFLCFFPAYNAIAGFFNNDCLLLPLQAGTVYYSLLYWRDGGRKNLAFIWAFATAAALTKLSGIIVLPLTGVALLFRLWRKKDWQTARELAVFGILLVLGLSIWPLYQHFMLGVDFDFVPPQEHLSLKPYSLWERFNPLGALVYPKMFYNDFGINLWETMTKTALFGQWDFSMRGAEIMPLIATLVLAYKAILLLVAGGIVYLMERQRNQPEFWLTLVLLSGVLAAQALFGLAHPYMCNQDFRYVAILALPIAMVLAQFLAVCPKLWRQGGILLLIGFAFLSAFTWWWIAR